MILNISYASSNSYAKHAGASMLSLFENNKEFDNIRIFFIEDNISRENLERLEEIAHRYNRQISFFSLNKFCHDLEVDERFPKASYAKLFLSRIEGVDKIIHLGCDTIVRGSLKELWNTKLDDYLVAGVQDTVSMHDRKMVGLSKTDKYINSDVLLFNLRKIREFNIIGKSLNFIKEFNGIVPYVDQGVLNGVYKDGILIVNLKYSVMPPIFIFDSDQIKRLYKLRSYYSDLEIIHARKEPIILHYTSGYYNKPWSINCTHPYKDEYIYYLDATSWDVVLENLKLPRNARIMKWCYELLPFIIYVWLERVIEFRRVITKRRR